MKVHELIYKLQELSNDSDVAQYEVYMDGDAGDIINSVRIDGGYVVISQEEPEDEDAEDVPA